MRCDLGIEIRQDVKKLEEFLAKHHFEDEGDSVPSSPWRPLCLARTPVPRLWIPKPSRFGCPMVPHVILACSVSISFHCAVYVQSCSFMFLPASFVPPRKNTWKNTSWYIYSFSSHETQNIVLFYVSWVHAGCLACFASHLWVISWSTLYFRLRCGDKSVGFSKGRNQWQLYVSNTNSFTRFVMDDWFWRDCIIVWVPMVVAAVALIIPSC